MHQTKQHLWNKIKWFNINEHQTETTEMQWVDAGNLVCLTTFSNEVWIHGDCKLYRCHRKFPSCCIKTPPSRAGRISVHAWASCSWEHKDENALVVLNLYTWQSDRNDVKNNKKKTQHFILLAFHIFDVFGSLRHKYIHFCQHKQGRIAIKGVYTPWAAKQYNHTTLNFYTLLFYSLISKHLMKDSYYSHLHINLEPVPA